MYNIIYIHIYNIYVFKLIVKMQSVESKWLIKGSFKLYLKHLNRNLNHVYHVYLFTKVTSTTSKKKKMNK